MQGALTKRIYLDDFRTPVDPIWEVVRNQEQFIKALERIKDEKIIISFDHDLDSSAMEDYFKYQHKGIQFIDYEKILEPTGLDCARYLISSGKWKNLASYYVHSANPMGTDNIINLLDTFLEENNSYIRGVKTVWEYV